MKHGKNPTVKQKILLKAYGLNPENWLICKRCGNEIVIEHRYTGTVRKFMRSGDV